jgi:DnaK suppressor protein
MPKATKAGTAKASSTAKAKKSSTSGSKTTAAKKASKASSKTASGKTSSSRTSAPKSSATKTAAAKSAATKATAAKATPAKTAAKKASPRGSSATADKFFEAQRKALLEERATYTRQAETLKAEADLLAQDRDPGDVQFDEESGEGDTIAVERERDLALSAQARAAVEEIDRALAKIDDGTYGVCEQCGKSIPRERLKALPYAMLCVDCKTGGLGRR